MDMRKAPFSACGPAQRNAILGMQYWECSTGDAIPASASCERAARGGWRLARLSVNLRPNMSSALLASSLSPSLASTAGMRALVAERARVQRLLDFVVALARAQAAVGLAPALATDKMAEAARAERYDAAVLAADAAGGIVPALISALTAEVARSDAEAARVVGFGASEQDALDTALALELRDATDLITSHLK